MLGIDVVVDVTAVCESLLTKLFAKTIPETLSIPTDTMSVVSLTTTVICESIEAILVSMDRS